jgi:hypothetical protein
MKSFKQYLMESVRTYRYKIKICGQPDSNWLDMFKLNLSKFDPVKIGEPKSTPIQSEPYGFPGVKDQPVTIMEVEFKYPAIEPMIKQLARILNYDENMVRMIQSDFDNSVNGEVEQYANQMKHSPVLDHEKLEDNGKQASRDYANQYLTSIMKDAKKDKIDFSVAGGPTRPAEDTRKIPGNSKSPMSQINRPSRPETGASSAKRG